MPNFIGEFDCKVDAKGRVMIPVALKDQLPGVATEGLVINRGFEKHLSIYTRKEWDAITERLNSLNQYERKVRQFIRYFNRGVTILKLDAAGRVILPKALLEYAGIESDVVLFAHSNVIEVWDRDAYENSLDNEPDNFADLAEDVLGSKSGKGGDGE